jgi:hypothetical protein
VRQASRERKRRKGKERLFEKTPLLSEKDPSLQGDSDSSDSSDCGIFEEIDEREQKEAQKAVSFSADSHGRPVVVAASVNDRDDTREGGWEKARVPGVVPARGGASVSVMSAPPRVQKRGRVERGRRGRVRGYGAVDVPSNSSSASGALCVSDKQPAPVVGSISEWSMMSPSEEEKRWLAESQEGI